MQKTEWIMGMPIIVNIVDKKVDYQNLFELVFNYFKDVDSQFSTYKVDSEVSKLNSKTIKLDEISNQLREILTLSEETKKMTNRYFDIYKKDGAIDPSGLVKGWAINNAANILKKEGIQNFFISAGSDIQTFGKNSSQKKWRVGIKNPFNSSEIVKIISLSGEGVATSGNYLRGDHIYDPHSNRKIEDIVSLTVIGKNIYEADRFATAAFAMGKKGINFLEQQKNLEGYMIDKKGVGTLTSGFEKFLYE